MHTGKLNLFSKTRFSLPEEDRATNGLLIILQHCGLRIIHSFLNKFNFPFDKSDTIFIREHVFYDSESIVDGEIKVPGKLLVAIESKIYKGQFANGEQIQKYYDLICKMDEKYKVIFLISPDSEIPQVINNIRLVSKNCSILWASWEEILIWLKEEHRFSKHTSEIESYLIAEYLDYLDLLNLVPIAKATIYKGSGYDSKLKYILGNETAEKVLLHIIHFKEIHALKIARDQDLPVNQVQQQLKRFEQGGLLKKEKKGNIVLYSFNRNNPFFTEVYEMVEKVYKAIPLDIKGQMFEPKYSARRSKLKRKLNKTS